MYICVEYIMSQIETCFFERYAIVSLQTLLGHDYDTLVNRDRPDLQTPDGRTIGIEVTRAMEENKAAAESLLDAVAGLAPKIDEPDYDRIINSGYGYGLQGGKVVGTKERYFWALAHPLRQIIESKVSKAISGLYGDFERMGLYIFCKDRLSEAEVFKTMKYILDLQEYADRGYDTLFLSEVHELNVCNLRDGISDSARIATFSISPEQCLDFFIKAV